MVFVEQENVIQPMVGLAVTITMATQGVLGPIWNFGKIGWVNKSQKLKSNTTVFLVCFTALGAVYRVCILHNQ